MADGGVELVYDPRDPRFVADPYPLYAQIRRENPIHRSQLGFRVITRHRDCLSILKDRRFSSNGRKADPELLSPEAIRGFQTEGVSQEAMESMAPFLFKDPPDHTRLRGLVAKAFTPRVVENLRDKVNEVASQLIDQAINKGTVDLVEEFSYPLPVAIISEMLGIPEGDRSMFRQWSDALARGLDPDFLLSDEIIQQRINGFLSFIMYFTDLIERRRANPSNDLISLLVAVEDQGDVLSHAELLSTLILLLVAGHETTVNLLSGSVYSLVQNQGEIDKLLFGGETIRNSVEELLRFVSPVQWTGRVATEPLEVSGESFEPGEFALMLIGSANRDPEVFVNPETLDLSRSEVNHLGFGFGLHHCLGAPLARLEAQVAIPLLFERANISLAVEEPIYKDNLVLRGLAKLPVTLKAK